MNIQDLEVRDFWRAIILYGLNQSTYKIALGQALIRICQQGKTKVSMSKLAEEFFRLYLKRLENGKPQLFHPNRRTAMEKIIDLYHLGKIDHAEAINRVEKEAFHDVIPRFHTVYNQRLPIRFYEKTAKGLVLTDQFFEMFDTEDSSMLKNELESRWGLLEAAFEMKRKNSRLTNDIRKIYLVNGYERTDITKNKPVLNGYQNNVCFYCGENLTEGDVHVDHVIPRQFILHDEIWNLVLAHGFCNEQKSDYLPSVIYIEKLIKRNEFFIESNHPIKEKLISQLGNTPKKRRETILQIFEDAKIVLGVTWEGIRGYRPQTDPFYRTFVRNLHRVD